MTGSVGDEREPRGRLTALLTGAAADATRAAGGLAGGVYLRSSTSGTLRLAVLTGLPGPLFRPWWRVHVDRPFPVAEAHRLGVPVVLANATETMRRHPQLAAGLPFPFGCLCVPVVSGTRAYGVVTVLRPPVDDATRIAAEVERLTLLADELGAALERLEGEGKAVVWDAEPHCVRPPATGPAPARVGHFTWDPATDTVRADEDAHALLGLDRGAFPRTLEALARTVTPAGALEVPTLLREAAAGRPPPLPVPVCTEHGMPRLLTLWSPDRSRPPSAVSVSGFLVDPSPGGLGDAAADLLPQGVFCVDRLGLVVYANPRAAHLLGVPPRDLLGRSLWDAVPWLNQPACEDHLRAALLTCEPAHFHVRRPPSDEPYEGDWLSFAVHPGPDRLTCTVVPAHRVPDGSGGGPAEEEPASDTAAPVYRPIVLAIALTEAVTARQVSEVVMRELLPAFGGNRLAIYLLQERHLYLAWESGFPKGFLTPFEGVALDARLPGVETLTTGRPLFFDSMRQLAAAYPGIPLDAKEGTRAFLPLIASGRPVGSCILGFDRPRSFGAEERTVLTALAGLIAHAPEKAQRYDTEAALARGLQQALLPRRLSAHPCVETAGRYLPGTEGMEVGGDWYDVVEAGDGLALVIGDVQGHGVQAAATMGQLRSAVRAFALGDRPPEEVMAGTNHLLIDLDPGQFASCCYVRLDPARGVARAVRAGHPPPLLRSPGGRTRVVDLPGGVVLGVDPRAHYPVTELRLEPGAILALYTDGLVERPGRDIDDGITALRLALARAGEPGVRRLAEVADRLTAVARQATDRPDDIALLLAARHGDADATDLARGASRDLS
ncbi:SpoIIE family protein phosphatase [Streptomyces galbus]|uniref:SpoIIE family protein phosphatase n=1 Tax=Streptomyces galbus TaxID=33898 RepID=A0ABX1IW98_STRGB|nr:SpoIIE family protein phosphatase [Streptomyces galbus]NKQ28566.1 SpoIIE family protein phosphatase [Streptomyces galbus]